MRILQVSAHFPAHGGGIEIVAGWLARQLSKAGLDVCWMAGGAPDEWPSDLPPAVTVVHARAVDLLEKRLGLPAPIWALSSLRQLYRLVGQADVVHIHDFLYMPTLVAAAFAAVHAKPLVITQHIGLIPFKSRLARGVLGLLNRSLGRWMLTHADRVVFVGRPVQSYFERFVQFRRAPRLIPNGVDHLQFQPGEQGRVSDAVQLLFVGRFVEKKGLSLLRQVLDVPGVRWAFVGRGPLSPAAWSERTPHVTVLEKLAPAQVAEQYRNADLLVLPSAGEGFPLVVQEALACGTPVLVSREVAEAFPQIDSRCVFDVELRCVDPIAALRARLLELTQDPARLRAARPHAVALARQWSWEACAQAYFDVFAQVWDAAQHT